MVGTRKLSDAVLVEHMQEYARRDGPNDFQGNIFRDARAPTNSVTEDHILNDNDKGAYLNVNSPGVVTITLPATWLPGHSCVVRRDGGGDVIWLAGAGSSIEVAASREHHTRILERFDEVMFRVTKNVNKTSAVWTIVGMTAP